MLIGDRSGMIAGAKLPYDSEVEYVQSNGTQYVDTGVYFANTTEIHAEFLLPQAASSNQTLCSVRSASCYVDVVQRYGSGTNYYRVRLHNSDTGSQYVQIAANKRAIVDYNTDTNGKYKLVVSGGNTYTANMHPASVSVTTSTVTIPIFGLATAGSTAVTNKISARLYAFTIAQRGGAVLRDFIPVRIGTRGYLYDRANPTGGPLGNGLYGSAFIPGPDKS